VFSLAPLLKGAVSRRLTGGFTFAGTRRAGSSRPTGRRIFRRWIRGRFVNRPYGYAVIQNRMRIRVYAVILKLHVYGYAVIQNRACRGRRPDAPGLLSELRGGESHHRFAVPLPLTREAWVFSLALPSAREAWGVLFGPLVKGGCQPEADWRIHFRRLSEIARRLHRRPIYQEISASPQRRAITAPAERYGPKARSRPAWASFMRRRCIAAPSTQPRKKASKFSRKPR
jgi:hypothetical protein